MSSDYVEPSQQYKNVEFEFGRVHLLWNCCAIVKKLLELEETVNEVEHKQENIPDDIDQYFAEFSTELHTATADIATLKTNVNELYSDVSDMVTEISVLQGDVDSAEDNLTALSSRVTQAENRVTQLQTDVSTLSTTVSGIADRVTVLETHQTTTDSTLTSHNTRLTQLETKTTALETSANALNTLLTAEEYYDNAALTSTITSFNTSVVTLSERALWRGPYGGFLRFKVTSPSSVPFNGTIGYITGETAQILKGKHGQNTGLYGVLGGWPSDTANNNFYGVRVGLFWEDTNNRFAIINRGEAIGMQTGANNVPFYVQFLDVVEQ